MKRLRNIYLFGMAAAFLLAACTASVSEPIEQDGGFGSQIAEENNASTKPGSSEGEASDTLAPTSTQRDYRIITLLPRDAIPAIDNPQYYSVQDANEEYDDQEQVLGVIFDGEARAYSVAKLSRHEIVNDTVGGRPISVTW